MLHNHEFKNERVGKASPLWKGVSAILKGIFGMQNVAAINQKIGELNRESWERNGKVPLAVIPQLWQPIDGYMAITGFEYKNGMAIFNANKGFPVKSFLNSQTGEVRMYAASLFEMP